MNLSVTCNILAWTGSSLKDLLITCNLRKRDAGQGRRDEGQGPGKG
jgi:hypothetical protein